MAAAGEPFLGVARSFLGRAWSLRPTDDRLALALAQSHGLPEIVARVASARGVTPETAGDFFLPVLRELLPDPSRLRDMDRAAVRLADAVTGGEPIVVFGDYDVDGATSAALLQRFARAVGARLSVYVPDRLTEGYGPNAAALLKLAADGARVVVTVDCGTLAYAPLAAAKQAGLDVIVVDHHLAEPALPPAVAVVNPNRLDDDSRQTMLAAVGVVFLLVVALNRELRRRAWFTAARPEPDLLAWLDLVALGTICDVVPLTGVNRALVAQGLKVMRRRTNPGLVALADVARVQERLDGFHAGFVFGPRVNAGGRVGKSDLGARLLATDDPAEAAALAATLDAFNNERRAIESIVLEQAIEQVAATQAADDALILVADRSWHPGVVGIVATRLKDQFNRPAVVVGFTQGTGRGSGRSLPGFDLGAAVIAARQAGLLVNGGGHAAAAGLTVDEAQLPGLRAFLIDRARASFGAAPPARGLTIDGAVTLAGASRDLLGAMAQLGPFGAGNAEPRLALAGVRAIRLDVMGQDHLRLILTDDSGARLKAVAFGVGATPLGPALVAARGRPIHLAGHLRADTWQGRDDVVFHVDDAAPAG